MAGEFLGEPARADAARPPLFVFTVSRRHRDLRENCPLPRRWWSGVATVWPQCWLCAACRYGPCQLSPVCVCVLGCVNML